MAVFRINKNENFVVMSNYHFKDKNLSLKAKGLLSEMLSLPEKWDYTIAGLTAINKENESAIKSALNELKQCGYLTVTKLMPNETKSGRIEYIYDIFELPAEKQNIEKQGLENQGVVFQGVENPGQYNINKSNIDNKKIKNKTNKEYIKAVIERLNEKAGTRYRDNTESTVRHIKARFNDGFSLEDFFTVIDKKVAEWKGTDMEKYLRPETLFGSKFESYLNARVINNQRRGVNGIALDNRETDELDGII